MTTSPVMGITEELLAELEGKANASFSGAGFVERVTGFSVIDLVAEVRRLREIVAQKAASATPAGWKLVPVEPTPEMIERSQYWHRCREPQVPPENFRGFYDALLAAAPAAPVAQELDTVAVPRDALRACRESLAGGLETVGSAEAEWSTKDRALVARIDALLAGGAE